MVSFTIGKGVSPWQVASIGYSAQPNSLYTREIGRPTTLK